MTKKLSLLLCAVLLSQFVSCGSAEDGGTDVTEPTETSGAESTEDNYMPDDLPDTDLNGYQFRILGFGDDCGEDSIMTPLGLRTLSRVPVVREGMADKIVDEYGSLQEVLEAVDDDPSRLGEIGVKNPDVLANSLHRMWGKGE